MKTTSGPTTATHLFILLALTLASAQAQTTNQVLALTNTACVRISSAPLLQNSNALTIEAWVYPFSVTTVLSKSDGGYVYSDRSYEVGAGGNSVGVNFFLGSSVWAGAGVTDPNGFDHKWTHLAASFSSVEGVIRLYTNGVLAAQSTNDMAGTISLAGQTIRQSSQPLVLGYKSAVGGPASLLLDEVRIWNVTRTPSEIQQAMYAKLTGAETNLVGYWNFDTGSANDKTANGLDGVFYGGAATVPDPQWPEAQITTAVEILLPPASPLTTFQVQYRTNVASTNWLDLGAPTLGNGRIQGVLDSTRHATNKFYRVIAY